jgi:predicted AlkP superfamily phosphohydrolase/phosphomutase
MGATHGAHFLDREFLYRLGVTDRPKDAPSSLLGRAPRVAWRILPEGARAPIRPWLSRLAKGAASHANDNVARWADVSTSRCFPVPNGLPVSGIRLNLVGREPTGVLQRGAEADAFCDQLTHDLLAIVDERTGSPLIAAVQRTDALYAGVRRDALPDLVVVWSDEVATGTTAYAEGRGATVRARSDAIGVAEGQNHYHRTGDHNPWGFFVLTGPRVPVATRQDPVGVMDFYPTLCSVLEIPAGTVDGDVVPELADPLR